MATAYVANNADATVSVIVSGTVTDTIALTEFDYPYWVAFTPDGSTAYVANNGAGNVSVIKVVTNTVTGTITVGSEPTAVAFTPDGSTAYVVVQGDDRVAVIDVGTATVTGTITVGTNPYAVAITPDGSIAYVTNLGGSNVSVIDVGTNTVTGTITVGTNPLAVAFTPDGTTAYVPNLGGGTVSVIDVGSATVTGTITVGSEPLSVAFTPDGMTAYVVNQGDNTVSVIDVGSATVTGTITVGSAPAAVAFSPDGTIAYVANDSDNTVTPITVSSGTPGTVIDVGSSPSAVAFAPPYAPLATVTTNPGSAETPTTVTLNGAVNPNGVAVTSCYFNYGPTTAYGSTIAATPAPGGGTGTVLVSADLTGLSPSTLIHFQLVAVNANGTAEGADVADRTLPPVYSPIGDTHTIRYLVTGSNGGIFAELPFVSVTFSKCFNQAGPFSATLNIEDEQVLNTNWITGTNPGKTMFWVIIDGKVVYGGRILNRTYQMSTQQVTITGSDFYSWWAQRLQAQGQDYTAFVQSYGGMSWAWAHKTDSIGVAGVPPPFVAWQLLNDAQAYAVSVGGNMAFLTIPAHGEGVGKNSDPDYWLANYPTDAYMTFSAPPTQQQSIDSLLQQLMGMGLGIGIDVVTDVGMDTSGNLWATVNVCWPRYGRTAAQLGNDMALLDISNVIDLQWTEDATAQANGIVEQSGAGGLMADAEHIDHTAIDTYNYPLLEQAISHTGLSPSALSSGVLATLLAGDQDLYAYPQLAPVATVPLFNAGTGFSITSLPMGDDIGVFNPFEAQTIYGLPSIPFPPPSSEIATGVQWMRLVRADVTIADEGVSTMDLTLNQPPGAPAPAGYNI